MPVKDPSVTHPYYDQYKGRWDVIRDVVGGSSVVKKAGARYLPMLSGQEPLEYEAYKMRALFMGATQRTLNGYVGMAFRKPAVLTATQETQDGFLSRCTASRKGFEALARQAVRELCQMGRIAFLVDLPKDAPANVDPWIALYQAENVTNWRYSQDETGERYLEMVTFTEQEEEQDAKDPNRTVVCTRWRVLSVESGTYTIEIYKKAEGSAKPQEFVLVETIIPQVAGRTLTDLPVEIVDLTDEDGQLTPPLETIADVNLSHYRSSADLEHGRHYTALPTPWVTGVQGSDAKLKIGSMTAWMIGDVNAKVGMLEFTGAGLQALDKALESKQQMMAILGARMLEEAKNTVEATQTHEIRRSGEQSILASLVKLAQDGLNSILDVAQGFAVALGDMSCELNTDFSASTLSAQDLTALISALQAGAISEETFFYNLDQGEMYAPDTTFEDESAQKQVATDKKMANDMKRLALVPPMNLGPSGKPNGGSGGGVPPNDGTNPNYGN